MIYESSVDFGERSIDLKVSPMHDGIKVKDFLRNHLKLSSTMIKRVKFGGIKLNGNVVNVLAILKSGDHLVIEFPDENSEGIEPIKSPLTIVYEDEHILVLDKPENMPVHPSKGNHLVTLANAVMAYMGRDFVFRAVNRLDRDTSGLVIVAKNQFAASRLSDDMKAGKFEKRYVALLSSVPKEKAGRVDAPIEREAPGNMKRVVRSDGKRAITEYCVTKEYDDGTALCEIRLLTGRTHQIRVHMAHIGSPLFADFLYGTPIPDRKYFLRCVNISFPHPVTTEILNLSVRTEC